MIHFAIIKYAKCGKKNLSRREYELGRNLLVSGKTDCKESGIHLLERRVI